MATQNNHQVTLGCGTLILIALIVLIFSNAGDDDLRNELRKVHSEIGKLETVVEAQRQEIAKLRNTIEKAVETGRVGTPEAESDPQPESNPSNPED